MGNVHDWMAKKFIVTLRIQPATGCDECHGTCRA